MLLLGRDRVPPAPQQASAAPTSGSGATEVRDEPIREVTEQTVATAPKPAGQSVSPASPPSAAASVPPAAASANVKPGATNPVAATPSKPAADRTDTGNAAQPTASRPESKTPVSAAKTTPTPKSPAPPVKPASNAKSPANAAKANATTTSAGRGTNKSVAAAPAKPAGQTAAKSNQGTLVVESLPPGATVFLDGKRVGATPLTIDTLKVGQYTIGLDIAGYKRWASTVRITPGDRSRVSASLER
jgi:hypothetical protein